MVHMQSRLIGKEEGCNRALKFFMMTRRDRPFLADTVGEFYVAFAYTLEELGAQRQEFVSDNVPGVVLITYIWKLKGKDILVYTGYHGDPLQDASAKSVGSNLEGIDAAARGDILYKYGADIITGTRPGPSGVPGLYEVPGCVLLLAAPFVGWFCCADWLIDCVNWSAT